MTQKMTFQRNLIGLEDLLLGTGTVSQTRGNTPVNVTKINASIFPYDDTFTLKEKIDSLDTTHYVDAGNLPVYVATPHSSSSLNLVDVIWIKDVSPTERRVYYYDKMMFKYNPTAGDLVLDPSVFSSTVASITAAYGAADTTVANNAASALAAAIATRVAVEAQMRLDWQAADTASISALDLGTASRLDYGNGALQLVQLDATAKLPAVDGSQLTNLPVASAASGSVVQRTFDESTAVTAYSSLIPRAGSAPANTVGTQILTRTITPKGIGNKLLIRFQGNAHPSAVGVAPTALLFVDGVFKKGTYSRSSNNSATFPLSLALETEIVAPSLTPIVVSIRVGPSISNGDIKFNDNSWGASGKGASLVIEEVKA